MLTVEGRRDVGHHLLVKFAMQIPCPFRHQSVITCVYPESTRKGDRSAAGNQKSFGTGHQIPSHCATSTCHGQLYLLVSFVNSFIQEASWLGSHLIHGTPPNFHSEWSRMQCVDPAAAAATGRDINRVPHQTTMGRCMQRVH